MAVKDRESFKGLERIFPSDNEMHNDMYESLADIRHLFCRLTNGKPLLSSSDFERKLYSKKWVKNRV